MGVGGSMAMLSQAARDWVSVLAPTASALAAVTALGLSLWVAFKQRQIQERQLKQSLYDKRYAVFLTVEEFLNYVLRVNGSVNLLGDEVRRFLYAKEQAEFLYKRDVVDYMEQLWQSVRVLYDKACKRDHLKKMNRQDDELNVGIVKTTIEINEAFVERRKKLFGPYLQLSPAELAEGSVESMKLNGWQRLWTLVAVLWLLPVAFFSYDLWPTTGNVSKYDVYMRLKHDDFSRLSDYYDVIATHLGGTNLGYPLAPFERTLPRLPAGASLAKGGTFDFLGARGAGYSDDEIVKYLSHTRNFDLQGALKAGSSKSEVINRLSNQAVGVEPTVEIADGHTLQFLAGLSQEDMNQTAKAYYTDLRRILLLRRMALLGEAFALWTISAIALYALGWAFGWVRRGFDPPEAS